MQHPALALLLVIGLFHDEITHAVDDRFAVDVLNVLGHVGMATDHGIGACGHHQSGQLALALVGYRFVFPAPVHDRNDQVGPVHLARFANVVHHLFVFTPRHAGCVVIGFKAAGHEFVVTQKRHPQAIFFDHPRRVRLRQIAATPHLAQPVLLQQIQHFGKRFATKIARMVVGQGHRIKVFFHHR